MITKTEVHTTTWAYLQEEVEFSVIKRNREKFPYTVETDESLSLNDLRNLKELIDKVLEDEDPPF